MVLKTSKQTTPNCLISCRRVVKTLNITAETSLSGQTAIERYHWEMVGENHPMLGCSGH